ncbi:HK97 family phage prohead protease [Bradyrhizobium sp. 157]|uniref:HK97 family phage prohead protease n=1 Tax=Bradyrhizobium sp. 157 TaxID=2782631 RepID=UPI001FFB9DD2|nr:HK97 family phage prohead protease [Bradyrhizobium sp. 157]MCK1640462.1 HK97 family phage prohead protease [Bradyrhizobium sp. 157]
MLREYETAAGPMSLEYGGGGYIAAVDGRKVAPSYVKSNVSADRYVIQGYAVRWNKLIHVNDKEFAWVAPYAIRDPMRGVKRLHFDHDESRTIGTTSDGLVLIADDYGLAMRFYPRDDVAVHREAVTTVRDNGRTALSVGITFENKQFEDYNGKRVRIVRDATLNEISLVPNGACREAYCVLIDKSDCGPLLSDDVKSKRVLADGGYANLMRALRKLDAKLN